MSPPSPPRPEAPRRLLLPLLLALAPLVLAGTPAPWTMPLETWRGLGSSFAEYRPSHLHAGVDLSTGGISGLPVRAAADGEIFRLRHDRRGYGKALYVRHPGGQVSVYAHLSAFGAGLGLEEMVRARAPRPGLYAGDIFLERPIAVRRGQVIALSGETGEGLPHLHFELRDPEGRPVSPWLEGLRFDDREPPVPEEIVLEPVGPLSAVNGGRDRISLPLDRPVSRPPVLRGRVRLRLAAHDRASSGSRLGIAAIDLDLDGTPVLRERLDRFSYDDTHRVGSVMDPLASHLSPTVFSYWLHRHPGSDDRHFSLSSPLLDDGLDAERLAPGPHRLEVAIRDAAGNEARSVLPFTVNHPPAARVTGARRMPGALLLQVAADDADLPGNGQGPALDIQVSTDGGRTWRKAAPRPGPAPEPGPAGGVRSMLLEDPPAGAPLQVRVRSSDGLEHSPWIRVVPGPAGAGTAAAPELAAEGHGLFALLRVRQDPPVWSDPVVRLEGPSGQTVEIPASWTGDALYEAVWPYPADAPGAWRAVALGAGGESRAADLEVRPVRPETGARLAWDDLEVRFPPGALYRPAFVRRGPSAAPADDQLRPVSRAWRLECSSQPFEKPATVSLLPDGREEDPLRVGVYSYDPFRRRWLFLDAVREEGGEGISAAVRHFSDYVLLEDVSPPTVSGVSPADGAAVPPPKRITFGLRDLGMGVDHERVEVMLDGRPLYGEYDPDRHTVTAPVETPPAKGKHSLGIRAFDRAGNPSAHWQGTFTVR